MSEGANPSGNGGSTWWDTVATFGTVLNKGGGYAYESVVSLASQTFRSPPAAASADHQTKKPKEPPASPMKQVPVQEGEASEEASSTPRTYASGERERRQRVTHINLRISAYVKRVFAYIRSEYSRSVDLKEVTQAGIAFLAQIIKVVQKVFPVPDLPVPKFSSAKPPKPSPFRSKPKVEETVKKSPYWTAKACEVLFGDPHHLKPEEAKLVESIGQLIFIILEEGKKQTNQINAIAALLADPEALKLMEEAVFKGLKSSTVNVNAKHFGNYKKQVIKRLAIYLEYTFPVSTTYEDNQTPFQIAEKLKETLSKACCLHSIFARERRDIGRGVRTHFYELLKERLAVAIPNNEYVLIRPLLASVIADQIKEGVEQFTSKGGIDALFASFIELLEQPLSLSQEGASPSKGANSKGLEEEEKPFILQIITTLLKGLFKANSLATVVEYFSGSVIRYVDQAIGSVIKVDSQGTSLDLGLINAILVKYIKAQQKTLASIPTQVAKTPSSKVKNFFENKPNMQNGWVYFDLIGGYEGTKKLYNFLQDHPWWVQNLIFLLLEDALNQFLPVDSNLKEETLEFYDFEEE